MPSWRAHTAVNSTVCASTSQFRSKKSSSIIEARSLPRTTIFVRRSGRPSRQLESSCAMSSTHKRRSIHRPSRLGPNRRRSSARDPIRLRLSAHAIRRLRPSHLERSHPRGRRRLSREPRATERQCRWKHGSAFYGLLALFPVWSASRATKALLIVITFSWCCGVPSSTLSSSVKLGTIGP